jgi:ParB family chromosome partitioning protein
MTAAATSLIVENVPLAAVVPYERNARTHSPEQVAQVVASIRAFGWTNPILVDEDNVLIAGHGRLLAARELGRESVPAIRIPGLSDEQRKALRLVDNKLALNSGWDETLLAAELADLTELRDLVGFSMDELRALSIGVEEIAFPQLPDGERSDFATMTFIVHRDQLAVAQRAIVVAKAAGAFTGPNANSNGNALARICSAFLEAADAER